MSNHTTREPRSGYPTFGLPSRPTGATTGRGGLGFDSSNNPQILDDAGNVLATFTTLTKIPLGYELGLSVQVSTTSGVVASLANPFGRDVMILSRGLRITTQSAGSCTLDIGTAANASTSADNLIDGASVAAAAMIDATGSNGKYVQRWGASQFLNIAVATGDANGVIGTLYVLAMPD